MGSDLLFNKICKDLKYYIALLVVLSGYFFSCKADKKREPKVEASIFEIRGKANSYTDQLLILRKKVEDSSLIKLVEFTNKDGFYNLKSNQTYPVDIYYLKLKNHPETIPFLLDNTSLALYLDKTDFSKSHITGTSPLQREYAAYHKQLHNEENTFPFQKKFIEEHAHSVLGSLVLRDMLGKTAWRLKELEKLFSVLDSEQQQSKTGKFIRQYLDEGLAAIKQHETKEKKNENTSTLKEKKKILVSETRVTEYAPYFYANNLAGTEISAKSVFNAHKLTLIDFWASWCVPCRAQTPDLVRLYNQYHSKGFEILSVSEDKEISNWNNAVSQDNMKWQHVMDDYKRLATMYGVHTIPHAILVDSQGGIVSKKISPYKLEKILKERLH